MLRQRKQYRGGIFLKSNIKYYLLFPAGTFPYVLLFSLYGLFFKGVNPFFLLVLLFLLFLISFICNAVFFSLSMAQKWDAKRIALANMIVKLIHIPAYLAIFVLGVLFIISIFTYVISIFFILFDVAAILLTGLIGVSAVIRARAEGKITDAFTVINGILQFIFCADVVSSIIAFVKAKKR